MYIHCEDEIYMLDRDNSVFLVPQLKFLSRKRKDDHIFETLIDGVSPMILQRHNIVTGGVLIAVGDGSG